MAWLVRHRVGGLFVIHGAIKHYKVVVPAIVDDILSRVKALELVANTSYQPTPMDGLFLAKQGVVEEKHSNKGCKYHVNKE